MLMVFDINVSVSTGDSNMNVLSYKDTYFANRPKVIKVSS